MDEGGGGGRIALILASTTIAPAMNVSTSGGGCKFHDSLLNTSIVQYLMCAAYITIFVTAVSGNCLVIYVVAKNKKMQTVTNLFIANLAVSDLCVNCTSLWLTPMYTIIGHWIWGEWLCRGLPLFQGTSIFISSLTLTAIAVDRYLVIVHHSQTVNINDHLSMRNCLIIIIMIWTSSLAITLPYAVHMKLAFIERCNFQVCLEDWSNEQFKSVYGAVVMILQFVVPFAIIGFSYRRIWMFLSNRRWVSERTVETNRRKRLLTMLLIMVLLFAVCWFPFNLLNIVRDLGLGGIFRRNWTFYFLLVHIISMTATCWNPLIYAWMNETFRDEFVRAIPILRYKFKSAPRVKVISDCKPATNRTRCSEAPAFAGKEPKPCLVPQPYDTLLVSSENPLTCAHSVTTLL